VVDDQSGTPHLQDEAHAGAAELVELSAALTSRAEARQVQNAAGSW
jgi:hypothetical protein